jgi:hypothetical protein
VAQLGTGAADTSAHTTAGPVTVQSSVTGLDLGYKTVCAVATGNAFCWGDDQTHQTSASAQVSCVGGPCQTASTAVSLTGTVLETRASRYASYARLADGKVWAWGANGSGQLGHTPGSGGDVGSCDPAAFPGGTDCNPTPTQVQGLP